MQNILKNEKRRLREKIYDIRLMTLIVKIKINKNKNKKTTLTG